LINILFNILRPTSSLAWLVGGAASNPCRQAKLGLPKSAINARIAKTIAKTKGSILIGLLSFFLGFLFGGACLFTYPVDWQVMARKILIL